MQNFSKTLKADAEVSYFTRIVTCVKCGKRMVRSDAVDSRAIGIVCRDYKHCRA